MISNNQMAKFLRQQAQTLIDQANSLDHLPHKHEDKVGHHDKKKKEKREKDPDAPKRPLSAYLLFSQQQTVSFKAAHPTMVAKDVVASLGKEWTKLAAEDKKKYEVQAEGLRSNYDAELDKYHKSKGIDAPARINKPVQKPVVGSSSSAEPKSPAKALVKVAPVPVVAPKASKSAPVPPAPAASPSASKSHKDDKDKKKRKASEEASAIEVVAEESGAEKKKKKKSKDKDRDAEGNN